MSMRKTLLIALLAPLLAPLLALLLTVSVTPALAQDKTFELKLSHWVPASHPLQKALEDWGAAVKGSGGRSNTRSIPRNNSARPSTTTTWRATVSPMSLTSTRAISPAASRSSARANFPS